jgi:hypothetical protein
MAARPCVGRSWKPRCSTSRTCRPLYAGFGLDALRKYRTLCDGGSGGLALIRPKEPNYKVVHAGDTMMRYNMHTEYAYVVLRGSVCFSWPGTSLPSTADMHRGAEKPQRSNAGGLQHTHSFSDKSGMPIQHSGPPRDALGRLKALEEVVPLMMDVPELRYAKREPTLQKLFRKVKRSQQFIVIHAPCLVGVHCAVFGEPAPVEVTAVGNCDCILVEQKVFSEMALQHVGTLVSIRKQLNGFIMQAMHAPTPRELLRTMLLAIPEDARKHTLSHVKAIAPDLQVQCTGFVLEDHHPIAYRSSDRDGYLIMSGGLEDPLFRGMAPPFFWPPLPEAYYGGVNMTSTTVGKVRGFRISRSEMLSTLKHIQPKAMDDLNAVLLEIYAQRTGYRPKEAPIERAKPKPKEKSLFEKLMEGALTPPSSPKNGSGKPDDTPRANAMKRDPRVLDAEEVAHRARVREILGHDPNQVINPKGLHRALTRSQLKPATTGTAAAAGDASSTVTKRSLGGATSTASLSASQHALNVMSSNIESDTDTEASTHGGTATSVASPGQSSSFVLPKAQKQSLEVLTKAVRQVKQYQGTLDKFFAMSMHRLIVEKSLERQLEEGGPRRPPSGDVDSASDVSDNAPAPQAATNGGAAQSLRCARR